MKQRLIDEALEKARELGIRNILALRGDPPRNEEYGDPNEDEAVIQGEEREDFVWAIDLVRYIRRKYGDYFCIGVAAYPDGHADQSHPEHQDPKFDLAYLVEKVAAGADFIMTQLFFDLEEYEMFEELLRNHPSGLFKDIPIVPGLMPIQSYQIIRRTTKLSHAKVPVELLERLNTVKGDDEEVKRVGVDILSEIVEALRHGKRPRRGFHFYTLNLEKAVSQIVERCHLIPDLRSEDLMGSAILEEPFNGLVPGGFDRRRKSSGPQNRLVVDRISALQNKDYEITQKEAGYPEEPLASRQKVLEISEGEGALGREATWDDFPNGRWGDARSPGKILNLNFTIFFFFFADF
jgi:methylenetetrahydrofolate reductase (NADPH)